MKWNNHKDYEGKHAFMGASNYHWLNYNDATFENRYYSQFSQTIGTTIHQLAHDCIISRTKLNKHDVHLIDISLFKAYIPRDAYDANELLNVLIPFVNDAIGFHMSSEILLYCNPFCFGTTDAIGYDDYNKELRIHDLKTGSGVAKMDQLYIYAAMFCKEYMVDPFKLSKIECRIYQNLGDAFVFVDTPEANTIKRIMDLIDIRTDQIAILLERNGK